MKTLSERIEALNPIARASVDTLVTLLEQSAEVDATSVECNVSRLHDLYANELYYQDSGREDMDLDEIYRIIKSAIACDLRAIARDPKDISSRNDLLIWQLRRADMDLVSFLHTGRQHFRRSAVEQYKELVRIMEKQPESYDRNQAINHCRTFWRRLESIYKNREGDETDYATNLIAHLPETTVIILGAY